MLLRASVRIGRARTFFWMAAAASLRGGRRILPWRGYAVKAFVVGLDASATSGPRRVLLQHDHASVPVPVGVRQWNDFLCDCLFLSKFPPCGACIATCHAISIQHGGKRGARALQWRPGQRDVPRMGAGAL